MDSLCKVCLWQIIKFVSQLGDRHVTAHDRNVTDLDRCVTAHDKCVLIGMWCVEAGGGGVVKEGKEGWGREAAGDNPEGRGGNNNTLLGNQDRVGKVYILPTTEGWHWRDWVGWDIAMLWPKFGAL